MTTATFLEGKMRKSNNTSSIPPATSTLISRSNFPVNTNVIGRWIWISLREKGVRRRQKPRTHIKSISNQYCCIFIPLIYFSGEPKCPKGQTHKTWRNLCWHNLTKSLEGGREQEDNHISPINLSVLFWWQRRRNIFSKISKNANALSARWQCISTLWNGYGLESVH